MENMEKVIYKIYMLQFGTIMNVTILNNIFLLI